ncbi:MAG TPA: MBL fold metallo-hydrolase, partial [Actinomycetota bacterium]|nr:MBL fold metallo-hydrolase [Actinomycetota bacterium]
MDVVTFVHEGLGNASYLLDLGEREAALVDPDRSIDRYLSAAAERGLRVAAVLETHLHADFVTGGREAVARGATVFAAEEAGLRWPHRPVRPGDRFDLGDAGVEVLETPGHTPEHVSFVVRAGEGPPLLFSGGALIVGGAARTDLIDPSMTEELTRALFQTLHVGLGELTDDTVVLPTHGGGSFCSTGAGGERSSTLGRERATNPVFAMEDEDEFVRWFPGTFPGVPAYFSRMRPLNRRGPRLAAEIRRPPPLDPDGFE